MKWNSAPESDDKDRWKELSELQRANPTKYNIPSGKWPFAAPFDAWLAVWWVAPLPTELEVKP